MTTATRIRVSYRSVDRYSKTRTFKTLDGARRFAHRMIGAHPDLGSYYAVSDDGVGRITVAGAALADLFPSPDERSLRARELDDLQRLARLDGIL